MCVFFIIYGILVVKLIHKKHLKFMKDKNLKVLALDTPLENHQLLPAVVKPHNRWAKINFCPSQEINIYFLHSILHPIL